VKFARELAPRIAGFHIRDIKGEKQLPFGTGDVDLPGLAKAIREKKWSGWVVVELEGQTVDGETPAQRVRAARRYMKDKMGIG
jgi:sugar phosphate isomerase/epimerase